MDSGGQGTAMDRMFLSPQNLYIEVPNVMVPGGAALWGDYAKTALKNGVRTLIRRDTARLSLLACEHTAEGRKKQNLKICKIFSLSILQNNEKAYWDKDTNDVAKWSLSKEILWAQTLPVWIRGDKDHGKWRKAARLLHRAEKLACIYVSPFKKGNDDPKGHPEILRAATLTTRPGQGWYSLLCFQGQGCVLGLWGEDALLCPRGGVSAESLRWEAQQSRGGDTVLQGAWVAEHWTKEDFPWPLKLIEWPLVVTGLAWDLSLHSSFLFLPVERQRLSYTWPHYIQKHMTMVSQLLRNSVSGWNRTSSLTYIWFRHLDETLDYRADAGKA